MSLGVPRLACAACGWAPGPPEVDPYPFRCPNAGADDGDHVVRWTADFGLRTSDSGLRTPDNSINPFVRYRTSLSSWHLARSRGVSDADFVSLVERVDAAVARVAGCGFRTTPFSRSDRLSARLGFDAGGGVWVKDETGNVSGSHKARHMMGVALYLELLRHLGIDREGARPLAVASCGNAALAAAVLARAIDRKLLVFVPDHTSPAIVARLEQLGAAVTRCARAADAPGDPSYAAFRRAIADGALPFTCQGNENGLVIEGATTLVYEMLDQAFDAARLKPCPTGPLPPPATAQDPAGFSLADRLFIQVGGGAFASACVQALADCVRAGRLAAMPRVHAVQTRGGYPLKRAYDLVVDRIFKCLEESGTPRNSSATDGERAAHLLRAASPGLLGEVFAYARQHRSQFMWPWETDPRSIASGILDDETYDWAAAVEGMVRSGGFPVVVDEFTLEEAYGLARETTGIDVDHTGAAGLAGLIALTRSPDKPRPIERVVAVFTGVKRNA